MHIHASVPGHALGTDTPARSRGTRTRDALAWSAIVSWHEAIGYDCVRDGLDHAHLVRSFLWDKVGRAIRRRCGVGDPSFETALLGERRATWAPTRGRVVRSAAFRRAWSVVHPAVASLYERLRGASRRGRPVLYVPFPAPTLTRTLDAVRAVGELALLAPLGSSAAGTRVPRWPAPAARGRADHAHVRELLAAIVEGLRALDVELDERDRLTLRDQITAQEWRLRKARSELDALAPRALLVQADNHSPFVEYTLLARQRGVPVIMLQHGLDCERHYLDEAYASSIAVWGDERRRRYERDSRRRPEVVRVTGNPEFDAPPAVSEIPSEGGCWLWLTRPHTPERCFAPSRDPAEGVAILDALLDALARTSNARLIIKPHPADYTEPYARAIERRGMRGRVEIWMGTLEAALSRARLVVTEDSTACIAAILADRPLVHAHFADSEPTLPLAGHGAALLARSGPDLVDAAAHAGAPRAEDARAMRDGQRAFLRDFAGRLDGEATRRVTDLIHEAAI